MASNKQNTKDGVEDLTQDYNKYIHNCHPDDRMSYTDYWENITGKRYPML